MGRETSAALKELFERAQTWPDEMQAEAVRLLRALDDPEGGADAPLSAEDIAALDRSADDVRLGRIVSEDEMRSFSIDSGADDGHLLRGRPG
jgi:hypothetical protein